MHEMQTIVSDVCSVCLSVCLSVSTRLISGFTARGSFGAAFAKSLWPLVLLCIECATCIMRPTATDDPVAWCTVFILGISPGDVSWNYTVPPPLEN